MDHREQLIAKAHMERERCAHMIEAEILMGPHKGQRRVCLGGDGAPLLFPSYDEAVAWIAHKGHLIRGTIHRYRAIPVGDA